MPEILQFDSDWFGFRIGRYDGDPPAADQWGKDNSVACLYTLLPLSEIGAVHDAARRGFRLVDVRVEFAAPTAPFPFTLGVGYAHRTDKARIQALARSAFKRTRFHNDRHFDTERVNDMYANWATGEAAVILHVQGGAMAGFVTVGATHLELIATDEAYRGRGTGALLTRAALGHAHAHGLDELRVVTQGGNHAAQRTFQSAGFALVETSLWLHKWYDR